MGGLTGSLDIALQSLLTQSAALDVTSNNIANANTPGYSRQRAVLDEMTPQVVGSLTLGQGVQMSQVQSVRDQVLEMRIAQETQTQGQLSAYVGGTNQLQSLFNETQGVGLGGPLSQFFSSLQNLSTNPSDLTLRQNVLNAGQALASSFNQTSSGLTQLKSGLDQSVQNTVTQVNQLTAQIASVNAQVESAQAGGHDAGQFLDQRNQLIDQLSNLVDVSAAQANDGSVTLTTTNGTALVVGTQSFVLQAQVDTGSGTQHVYAQGQDITSRIASGQLGGLIQARDRAVASAQTSLDNLAYNLANAFNAQHAQGYDLSGSKGGNFFTLLSSSTGAAAQLSVALTNPAQAAASSDGTAGSNGNALALAGIQNQAVINGQSPSSYYSSLIASIGGEAQNAQSQQTAQQLVMQQLQNQRASVSGVSLDEEATNLVQYQNAYAAAGKIVSIIEQLTQVTLNM